MENDNPGPPARLERLAGFAPARPGWRPGMLLLHQSRVVDGEETEQVAGIEPCDPGMAYRCVTTTLHLRRWTGPPDRGRARSANVARLDSWRGPGGNRTHVARIKNPVQRPTFATSPT